MASLLNTKVSTYKRYEMGVRSMNLRELNILSNYFNVSLNALLGLTKNINSCNKSERINYKMLACYIKFIRKRNGYTQQELAKAFNIAPNSISKYETKPRFISLNYLYLFAKKFNISIDYICNKTNKKEVL